jgi:hypothetical protein
MRPSTPNQHGEPHPPEDDEELMRQYISEAGNPSVAPPPEHVAKVRSLLLERLDPPRPVWRRKGRLLVGSGVVAVSVLFALLMLNRPVIAWDELAKALQGRAWVHGTVVGPDGTPVFEEWLSSNREMSAVRAKPEILFHDSKRKVFTKYVSAESTVYRLPPPAADILDRSSFLRQLLNLFDPNRPGKFLFPGMEVIGQTRRNIEEGTKKWFEIEVTLRVAGGSRGGPLSARIRVEPATNLPHSLTLEGEDGKYYTASIDYPDRGPDDIYDLGVPRTANVVDRIPADEVGPVLVGLKAGRLQFDDYCAFVIQERVLPTNHLPRTTAYRVWRKGPKWRIDELRPLNQELVAPADVDTAWWKAHQNDFTFIPSVISDGKEYWFYYLPEGWKPGMPVLPVGSGQVVGPNPFSGPSDDPILPFWCQYVVPEQAGHLNIGLGLPDHDREFLVETRTAGGPPETILLRGRDAGGDAAGKPDYFRLWIDPKANYLAMKAEIRVSDPSDRNKVAFIDTQTVETAAKSPKGHSYPTRTRQLAGVHEMVRKFYVDFEAEVADELFEPLKTAAK